MIAWNIQTTYDGEVVHVRATPSPAASQDLGLPACRYRRSERIGGVAGEVLAFHIAELTEQVCSDFLRDAHRAARHREQLELPFTYAYGTEPLDFRGVRPELLGRRR